MIVRAGVVGARRVEGGAIFAHYARAATEHIARTGHTAHCPAVTHKHALERGATIEHVAGGGEFQGEHGRQVKRAQRGAAIEHVTHVGDIFAAPTLAQRDGFQRGAILKHAPQIGRLAHIEATNIHRLECRAVAEHVAKIRHAGTVPCAQIKVFNGLTASKHLRKRLHIAGVQAAQIDRLERRATQEHVRDIVHHWCREALKVERHQRAAKVKQVAHDGDLVALPSAQIQGLERRATGKHRLQGGDIAHVERRHVDVLNRTATVEHALHAGHIGRVHVGQTRDGLQPRHVIEVVIERLQRRLLERRLNDDGRYRLATPWLGVTGLVGHSSPTPHVGERDGSGGAFRSVVPALRRDWGGTAKVKRFVVGAPSCPCRLSMRTDGRRQQRHK